MTLSMTSRAFARLTCMTAVASALAACNQAPTNAVVDLSGSYGPAASTEPYASPGVYYNDSVFPETQQIYQAAPISVDTAQTIYQPTYHSAPVYESAPVYQPAPVETVSIDASPVTYHQDVVYQNAAATPGVVYQDQHSGHSHQNVVHHSAPGDPAIYDFSLGAVYDQAYSAPEYIESQPYIETVEAAPVYHDSGSYHGSGAIESTRLPDMILGGVEEVYDTALAQQTYEQPVYQPQPQTFGVAYDFGSAPAYETGAIAPDAALNDVYAQTLHENSPVIHQSPAYQQPIYQEQIIQQEIAGMHGTGQGYYPAPGASDVLAQVDEGSYLPWSVQQDQQRVAYQQPMHQPEPQFYSQTLPYINAAADPAARNSVYAPAPGMNGYFNAPEVYRPAPAPTYQYQAPMPAPYEPAPNGAYPRPYETPAAGQYPTGGGAMDLYSQAPVGPATYAAAIRTPGAAGAYSVQRGDTLYSIARRHGVPLDHLTHANGISRATVIHPGQVLRIPGGGAVHMAAPAPAPQQDSWVMMQQVENTTGTYGDTFSLGNAVEASLHSATPAAPSGEALFGWPIHGQVYAHNGALGASAIEIRATAGAPVQAAAAGHVIHVEEGQLGTLIVIEHANGYRSHYLGLDNPMVQKGQRVGAGQPIASVAFTPNPRVTFEIRRNGERIDAISQLRT